MECMSPCIRLWLISDWCFCGIKIVLQIDVADYFNHQWIVLTLWIYYKHVSVFPPFWQQISPAPLPPPPASSSPSLQSSCCHHSYSSARHRTSMDGSCAGQSGTGWTSGTLRHQIRNSYDLVKNKGEKVDLQTFSLNFYWKFSLDCRMINSSRALVYISCSFKMEPLLLLLTELECWMLMGSFESRLCAPI